MHKKLSFLLVFAMLLSFLSSCLILTESHPTSRPPAPRDRTPDRNIGAELVDDIRVRDERITLPFSATDAIHPYRAETVDNQAIAAILYEGLFTLGGAFVPEGQLATEISTLDGQTYQITLREGVQFHNGGTMTGADVLYSFAIAQDNPRFSGRLSNISAMTMATDEEGEPLPFALTVRLSRPHGNLAVLLNFPIIQDGAGGWTVPPGTGAFSFEYGAETSHLLRHDGHWAEERPSFGVIYLADLRTQPALESAFNAGSISLLPFDPILPPALTGRFDTRNFPSATLEFLGFNAGRSLLREAEVRRAISLAIDRGQIADNFAAGQMVPTPQVFHPLLDYYDNALSVNHMFNLEDARLLFDYTATPSSPLPEDNEDDAPTQNEQPEEERQNIELTLLLVSGNMARVQTAQLIADSLRGLGLTVILDPRAPEDYLDALASGDFDLYLGSVRLQPDFDVTTLLTGSLARGGTSGMIDRGLIDGFLATDPSERGHAAATLSEAMFTVQPIAPLGFRGLSLAVDAGSVVGLSPSQDNVYGNIWNWHVPVPEDDFSERND